MPTVSTVRFSANPSPQNPTPVRRLGVIWLVEPYMLVTGRMTCFFVIQGQSDGAEQAIQRPIYDTQAPWKQNRVKSRLIWRRKTLD